MMEQASLSQDRLNVDFTWEHVFFAVDFDGTVSERDVTESVLNAFASPEWLAVEAEWRQGLFGSQVCLARQMALVRASWDAVMAHVNTIGVDPGFAAFVRFAAARRIPVAVISDGFLPFIRQVLANASIPPVPVYANELTVQAGRLQPVFPNACPGCPAGTCKCHAARSLAQGRKIVLIGDGHSDFCLADKADFVWGKGNLAVYCRGKRIRYRDYRGFDDVVSVLAGEGPQCMARLPAGSRE